MEYIQRCRPICSFVSAAWQNLMIGCSPWQDTFIRLRKFMCSAGRIATYDTAVDPEVGRAAAAETLVFINYRSKDAAAAAALLHSELAARLGEDAVFLDYESIPLGHDFEPQLLERVRGCAVLLAVVGARWLNGEPGRRAIDNPNDWVRKEILEALAHHVPVVPILMEGANLKDAELPPDLAVLPRLQYFEFHRLLRAETRTLIDNLIRQVPRLRRRPVKVPTPFQAVVAALQDSPGADSTVRLTVDVNEHGTFDQITLSRTVPRITDRLVSDPNLLRDMVRAAGLRDDDVAQQATFQWVAEHALAGRSNFDRQAIEQAVNDLGLRNGPPRAVLSVATLKPDPMAAEADHALDWVDRFGGSSAYLKRRPLPPATWQELQADIETIPLHLPPGRTDVLLTGSLRQATAFTIGGALRMVTGLTVAVSQGSQLWSSSACYDAPLAPSATEHNLHLGDDLAIALAIAIDPTADVLDFIANQNLPVDRLVTLGPPSGTRDNVVPDAEHAVALSAGIRDAARRESRNHPRIHLFLAGPMGLALLLGHRWNRVRPTVVYEDVQSDVVYEQAFTLDA